MNNLKLAKKFLRGSSLLSLEKIIRIVLGLTIHTWVVRKIGAVNFGYITYATGVVLIFQTFSVFGLDEIASKKFVQTKDKQRTFEEISSIRFRFSLFAYILMIIFAMLTHTENLTTMIMCMVFGLSLFPKSMITVENYFVTREKYVEIFWSRLSACMLVNVGKVLAVVYNLNLISFMVIYLAEEIIQRLVNFHFMKNELSYNKNAFLSPLKKDLTLQALPMFFYSFLVILDQKTIVILLQYFGKIRELGVFSVSFGLYEYTFMFPLILSTVLFPSVVRANESNPKIYQKRKQYLSDIMVVMGLAVSFGFFIFGDLVIATLYGPDYVDAKIYLRWIALLCPITFFNMARLRWFVIEGLMHEWMVLSFTILLINVLLQVFILPKFGLLWGIGAIYLSIALGNLLCAMVFEGIRDSLSVFIKSLFFWFRAKELIMDLKKEI